MLKLMTKRLIFGNFEGFRDFFAAINIKTFENFAVIVIRNKDRSAS